MGKIMCVLLVFLVSPFVMANNNGLVTVKSQHDVELTANRLERILLDKGMTIFARVKHAEAAWELGKKLRPTELIIFGNPKIGTLLCNVSKQQPLICRKKHWSGRMRRGQYGLAITTPIISSRVIIFRDAMK